MAVDNALLALSLVSEALREPVDEEVLAGFEETVNHISDRLMSLGQSG